MEPGPYVRYAVSINWPPGFVWGPRCLYDHELIYVLNGELTVQLGRHEFVATADHLILVPPRLPHSFEASSKSGYNEHLGVHFDWQTQPDSNDPRLLDDLLRNDIHNERLFRQPKPLPCWDIDAMPVLNLSGRPAVRSLLNQVVTAYSERFQNAGWQVQALSDTFDQLAYEVGLLQQIESNLGLGADAIRRAQRAREILEAPRPAPLPVGAVAAQVGWSADHLGRVFRELYGKSPYRIQSAARIVRASGLLESGESIEEAARQCGFFDLSNFIDAFKKETEMTPRQFIHRRR